MNKKNQQAYDAYWQLQEHYPWALANLDVAYMKVDPVTRQQEDDQARNTHIEVWLETGPNEYAEEAGRTVSTHDIELDCGGDTFEEALVTLCRLVQDRYLIGDSWDDEAAS